MSLLTTWRARRTARRLAALDLFAACSPAELATIDPMLAELPVPGGRVLVREGTAGREFMIVADGSARVERDGEVVARIGPGGFFGEMALTGDGVRSATVVAETPMRLYVLSPGEFARLLRVAPSVRATIEAAAEERSRLAA